VLGGLRTASKPREHYSDYDEEMTARCERALVTLLGDLGPWRERIAGRMTSAWPEACQKFQWGRGLSTATRATLLRRAAVRPQSDAALAAQSVALPQPGDTASD
jgi:hypothetical protein